MVFLHPLRNERKWKKMKKERKSHGLRLIFKLNWSVTDLVLNIGFCGDFDSEFPIWVLKAKFSIDEIALTRFLFWLNETSLMADYFVICLRSRVWLCVCVYVFFLLFIFFRFANIWNLTTKLYVTLVRCANEWEIEFRRVADRTLFNNRQMQTSN